MKAFAFSMLCVCVLLFAGLTIQAWRDGDLWFVIFGSMCAIMFIAGCVWVVRSEDEPTAEQLRDSDEHLFYDARSQFIESRLAQSKLALIATGFIVVVLVLVLVVMWGGFVA